MGRSYPISSAMKEGRPKRQSCMSGIVFDAGGLIALDRNDRRLITLLERTSKRGMR